MTVLEGKIPHKQGCRKSRSAKAVFLRVLFLLLVLTTLGPHAVFAGNTGNPLTIVYPEEGAVFPRDMVFPPTFRWSDETGAVSWEITFRFDDEDADLTFQSPHPRWQPEFQTWETIRKRSLGKKASVTIRGNKNGASEMTLTTSKDPVGAPIFYRDVPLPFSFAVDNTNLIEWKLGFVDRLEKPRTVISNFNVCGSCHSLSRDGRKLAMDVDYEGDKGGYIISDIGKDMEFRIEDLISWNDYRRGDGGLSSGLLSEISPDGRYVASTVKNSSVLVTLNPLDYSLLFYPVKGILAIYDVGGKYFFPLPGGDDPEYVQTNPSWSPDGDRITFAMAPRKLSVYARILKIFGKRLFRYDLYTIPFNEGKGGKAEPVPGASRNGKSNYYPKYSPDGKWIVFCQADNYMLLQRDSELFIMPAGGGPVRRMACNRQNAMNSWHSFSPNGRWLVFASKKEGPYTQLWLTHLDEKGQDSAPVLLEAFMTKERAANIPEFVNLSAEGMGFVRHPFQSP